MGPTRKDSPIWEGDKRVHPEKKLEVDPSRKDISGCRCKWIHVTDCVLFKCLRLAKCWSQLELLRWIRIASVFIV